jgi:hypothetical protein
MTCSAIDKRKALESNSQKPSSASFTSSLQFGTSLHLELPLSA